MKIKDGFVLGSIQMSLFCLGDAVNFNGCLL